MKKITKFLFLLLVTAVLTTALSLCTFAADEDIFLFSKGSSPEFPQGGVVFISAKNENISGDIVIPETCDGEEVRAISDAGFSGCKNITSITIPATVKVIASNAFYNCTNLEKIIILGEIESVGYEIVVGTKWLENQPEGFVYLDDICVDYKGEVPENSDLIVKEGTRIIAPSIFYRKYCDVNSVILPEGLEEIGEQAFWGCGAESVVFGDGLKKIGVAAFGANNISEFIIPDSVTEIDGGAFKANPIKTIKLPEGLTVLRDLFSNTSSLPENLHIPKNVSSIDMNMFKNSSAKNFSIDEENQYYWTDGKGLYNKSVDTLYQYLDKQAEKIELPDTVKTIPENAFRGFHNLKEVILSPSMDKIINNAFKDCSALETVVIPEGIKQINEAAFAGCDSLEKIYLPDSITKIFEGAFSNCGNLSEVRLPEGLTGLGNIFHECKKLTQLHLPKNMCSVKGFLVDGTNYIEKFTVDENNEYICADESGILFSKDKTRILCYPTQLKGDEYTIPETVTNIDAYAFEGNHYLKTVTFNENISGIGEGAFHYCENLENFLSIPDKAIIVEIGAFDRTKWYSNQPDRVVYFGKVAYTYKGSIGNVNFESIALREDTKSIASFAFFLVYDLETIVISDKLEFIGNYAFDITAVKNVIYSGTKEQWDKITVCVGNGPLLKAKKTYETVKHIFIKTEGEGATFGKNGILTKYCECGYSEQEELIGIKEPTVDKKVFVHHIDNHDPRYPKITVKRLNGKALTYGTDYTLKWSEENSFYPGNYTVTVKLLAPYEGERTISYQVVPAATDKITATTKTDSITLNWTKADKATGYRVYQYNPSTKKWKKIASVKTNTYTVKKLKAGTDYKFRIKSYTKFSNGDVIFSTKYKTFETATKPLTPTVKLSSTKAGTATITWTNVSGESGYQVYYSTSKNGTYKKVNSYKADTLKATKSKLTRGKTYYFKVRAYKKTPSGTVFGSFSSVKSVKIK